MSADDKQSALNGRRCRLLVAQMAQSAPKRFALHAQPEPGKQGGKGRDADPVMGSPAKKQKTRAVPCVPRAATAAAGAPTPAVPSPPSGVVGSETGGVAATPAHPALEASEDEAGRPEEEGHTCPIERPNLVVVPCRQRPKHAPEARRKPVIVLFAVLLNFCLVQGS